MGRSIGEEIWAFGKEKKKGFFLLDFSLVVAFLVLFFFSSKAEGLIFFDIFVMSCKAAGFILCLLSGGVFLLSFKSDVTGFYTGWSLALVDSY